MKYIVPLKFYAEVEVSEIVHKDELDRKRIAITRAKRRFTQEYNNDFIGLLEIMEPKHHFDVWETK